MCNKLLDLDVDHYMNVNIPNSVIEKWICDMISKFQNFASKLKQVIYKRKVQKKTILEMDINFRKLIALGEKGRITIKA